MNEYIPCASRVIHRTGSDHRRRGTQPCELQTTVQCMLELEGSGGDLFLMSHSASKHKSTSQSPPWEEALPKLERRTKSSAASAKRIWEKMLSGPQSQQQRLAGTRFSEQGPWTGTHQPRPLCLTWAKPDFSIDKLELFILFCSVPIFLLAKMKRRGSYFTLKELVFLGFPVQGAKRSGVWECSASWWLVHQY